MKKITALILAVLFIVALPAQTFAANEENEPEAFSSEKMLEKFPEADLVSPAPEWDRMSYELWVWLVNGSYIPAINAG